MPSPDALSPADQELIGYAAARGEIVTPKRLRIWRARGLVERNVVRRLGRGRGTVSRPTDGAKEMVLWLARNAKPGGRPDDLALRAFADGMPVPEAAVRTAFRVAVDRLMSQAEQSGELAGIGDPQQQAEVLAQRLAATGRLATLVPARIRRLDEAIRDLGVDWSAPQLAALDRGVGMMEPARVADLLTTAVEIIRTGRGAVHNQALGDFFRAVAPSNAANPIASLIEHLDVDDEGLAVQDLDGVLFEGDIRDGLRQLVAGAPLPLLHHAWQSVDQIRAWAHEFCCAAEAEVAARRVGPSVLAWFRASLMPTRMFLISVLKPGRPSPAEHARTAAELLMIRDMLGRLHTVMPGLQWDLLDNPDLMPDCVRAFLVPARL
ncbi:hypothetical protein GCM10019016_010000 [Streptomyces prasinosporus]|uniref:Uncharacterized protein n=1 Tax=Streptomyces prasinosporus TaxID=68256 RepID=A0ABP6THQ7_9ACTN|nr:hypothetical protein GCM10010332_69680 [Streptomyces albogriseolus]